MDFNQPLSVPDLKAVIKAWGNSIITDLSAEGVYLFGSLVYKEGKRFVAESDIDLVVIFPTTCTVAFERFEWAKSLYDKKFELEQKLLTALGRTAVVPFASIVLVTREEINLNIHKDGTSGFFSENEFEDLTDGSKKSGLSHGLSDPQTARLLRAVVSFAQKVRNQYLGVMANNRSDMLAYNGEDPMPKVAMRSAAMALAHNAKSSTPGEEYDTKEGLDYFGHELYELKIKDPRFSELQELFSIRRKARGDAKPLSKDDQLLIAEIIFDLVFGKAAAARSKSGSEPKTIDVTMTEAISISDEPSTTKAAQNSSESKFLDSSVFFAERFKRTFPGIRDIKWFYDSVEATKRLLRLLEPPLGDKGYFPIWWWRDGNLHIERCATLSDTQILLNVEELQITKIAAWPGDIYKQAFVYVETSAMPPIGIYNHEPEYIERRLQDLGYADEEYGLYKGRPISRSEYDDAAAEIDGEAVDTGLEAELRVRFITPYNFVIAAQASPINNYQFDSRLVALLNAALKFDSAQAVNELVKEVRLLPIRPY